MYDACICVLSVQKHGRERQFLCKCSFLEIYKEVITDLLNPAATRLHIREDAKTGMYVEGLSETVVVSGMLFTRVYFYAWPSCQLLAHEMPLR